MSVSQYLQHYAEPEIQQITDLDNSYQNILTIPVFNESDSFILRLEQLTLPTSLLIILVLNAPDDLESPQKLHDTQKLGQQLKNRYTLLKRFSTSMHLLVLDEAPSRHILLVERCDTGKFIPAKEGVGLARKIACDIACKLISLGYVQSPWIHSTDADVTLPANYFECSDKLDPRKTAAALYPFQHTANDDPHLNYCQGLYDISLYYYVEGLHWAKSPYAFHTIGSTLLINFQAYALARGFPKRAAGEDFYLLNKIAKTSAVVTLSEPCITIDSRKSDRVPFGTGPALIKIADLENAREDYLYYNPLCFQYLKTWLKILPKLWQKEHDPLSLETLQLILNEIDPTDQTIDLNILLTCLQSLGVKKALIHAKQNSKTHNSYMRHWHNWFDAFRTLKFIHYVRDFLTHNDHPSLAITELSLQANFLSSSLKNSIEKLT